MPSKTKKILITRESHETLIVRRERQKAIRGFCPECKTEVELLTFDSAEAFSRIGGHEMVRKLEAGAGHLIETGNKHLLICPKKLNASHLHRK